MKEDIRRNTRDGVLARVDEEEKFSLARKGNKSKGKNAQGKPKFS